jgi:hypothetical protein
MTPKSSFGNVHTVIVEDNRMYIDNVLIDYLAENDKISDAVLPHVVNGEVKGEMVIDPSGAISFTPEKRS